MSKVAKQTSSTSFFNNTSLAKGWTEIESAITAMAHSSSADDSEVGWIEGHVHETRSTQKEVEILLVHAQDSKDTIRRNEALKVFMACADYPLFAFSINQHIKISLKGARILREISSPGSSILPFSLGYGSIVMLQVVRGGVCMPDGTIVDTRENPEGCGERCFPSAAGFMSLLDATPTVSPQASPKTPPPRSRKSTRVEASGAIIPRQKNNSSGSNAVAGVIDGTTCPALSTLALGMDTPLLGIVESAKSPQTASSGNAFVTLTLADASSYDTGSGFKVTCFSSSKLTHDLPMPSVGDAILFKTVKITKFPNGNLIGNVAYNWLDWMVYSVADKDINIPRHSIITDDEAEPDPFYQNEDRKKEAFEQFIEVMDSGPARKYTLRPPKAKK